LAKVIDQIKLCPSYQLMTDYSFANLKSSIFYIFLSLLITPLIFWTKVSSSISGLLAENILFLVYLLFFSVAVLKALNYRWSIDEREYIRSLQIKEVLFEEEEKLNRKLSKKVESLAPFSSLDQSRPRGSSVNEDHDGEKKLTKTKDFRVRIDYEETSLFKEIVFRLID
jgi:glucan phosphoethanolaminetransferase (alkaline phosphatase superfamily)